MKSIYRNTAQIVFIALSLIFVSCGDNANKADAYGNFEAKETIISAMSNGEIIDFTIDEGDKLDSEQFVGWIDTIALKLQKEQILAQRKAVASKADNVLSQIDVLNEQKKSLIIEKERVEALLKDEAATQQQLDNINGKINVIKRQIESVRSQNSSVLNELDVVDKQVDIINYQLTNCKIINPLKGVVLETYVEKNEVTATGRPLYKIANINKMYLRAYISGNQLPNIKIGQKVKVAIDKNETTNRTIDGEISWIAQEAEFTPKIIQTKEERVQLVYAIKVKIKNDGSVKIGMPGEIYLIPN